MAKANLALINQHLFRSQLDQLPELNANQIEDLLSSTMDIRRARASLSKIEVRVERDDECLHCGGCRRQNGGKPEPEFGASGAADV